MIHQIFHNLQLGFKGFKCNVCHYITAHYIIVCESLHCLCGFQNPRNGPYSKCMAQAQNYPAQQCHPARNHRNNQCLQVCKSLQNPQAEWYLFDSSILRYTIISRQSMHKLTKSWPSIYYIRHIVIIVYLMYCIHLHTIEPLILIYPYFHLIKPSPDLFWAHAVVKPLHALNLLVPRITHVDKWW